MISINHILCPIDLSLHSGNATRYALALSRCPVVVARHLRPACGDWTEMSLQPKCESEMDCAGEI